MLQIKNQHNRDNILTLWVHELTEDIAKRNANLNNLTLALDGKKNSDAFEHVEKLTHLESICLAHANKFEPSPEFVIKVPSVTVLYTAIKERLINVISTNEVTGFAWQNRDDNYNFYSSLESVEQISINMKNSENLGFIGSITSKSLLYCKLNGFGPVDEHTELPVELRDHKTLLVVVLQKGGYHDSADFKLNEGPHKVFSREFIQSEWIGVFYP